MQPYDERQYLSAFNRAVKAGEDLRNLTHEENAYKLNMAERNLQRAEKEYDIRQAKNEEMMDKMIAEVAGTDKPVNHESRRENAVQAWTIHNNGMTLPQYIRTITAQFPGYFGNWTPDEEELKRIEAEVKKPAKAPKKGSGGGKGGGKPGGFDLGDADKTGGFEHGTA